ncbi:MAG: twin-arginine translocase TatA/TatE family subunit [Phycisphaerales bacterium]
MLHVQPLSPPTLAFIQNFGVMEWAIIAVIALLIFGRRLPEVGKSLGKGIIEFKKGLKGIEDDIDTPGKVPVQQPNAWQQGQALPPPMSAPPAAAPAVPQGQPHTVSREDAPHV